MPDLQSVCIEGQKKIRYRHRPGLEEETDAVSWQTVLSGKKSEFCGIEMDNWDFMLFAQIFTCRKAAGTSPDEFYNYLLHGS